MATFDDIPRAITSNKRCDVGTSPHGLGYSSLCFHHHDEWEP
jgi:hypothetical protein